VMDYSAENFAIVFAAMGVSASYSIKFFKPPPICGANRPLNPEVTPCPISPALLSFIHQVI